MAKKSKDLPVLPRIKGPKKVWAFAPIGPGAGVSPDRLLDKQEKLKARYDARVAKAAQDRMLLQRVTPPGYMQAFYPLMDLPDPR